VGMDLPPFHLAFPVHDLASARAFYGRVLGCREGRSSDEWVDFDFFGHQIVAHRVEDERGDCVRGSNRVAGHRIPVPHFGAVLAWEDLPSLEARLRAAGVPFAVEPHVRFAGPAGEQATFFVEDPSGNVIEFKAMRRAENLFAR
jgi:extradiol dioxygenase family protein